LCSKGSRILRSEVCGPKGAYNAQVYSSAAGERVWTSEPSSWNFESKCGNFRSESNGYGLEMSMEGFIEASDGVVEGNGQKVIFWNF